MPWLESFSYDFQYNQRVHEVSDGATTILRQMDWVDVSVDGGPAERTEVTSDPIGNVTAAGGDGYTYSARNLLSGLDAGGQSRLLGYDASGWLTTVTAASGVTTYLRTPDGQPAFVDRPEYENDWTWIFAGATPLAGAERNSKTGASVVQQVITDRMGFPTMVLPNRAGKVLWSGTHTPFGELTGDPAGAPPSRYPGQWNIGFPEANDLPVTYNLHRWYVAGWGRYTQADPIWEELRFSEFDSPYVYVSNNPLLFTDPLGLRRLGFGGRFCLGENCKGPGPISVLGEDAPVFVPPPKCPGDCVDADAVYGPLGVVKIRDFGTCWLRCNPDGSPRDIACGVPPPMFFPCGTPLPQGWPPNPGCNHG